MDERSMSIESNISIDMKIATLKINVWYETICSSQQTHRIESFLNLLRPFKEYYDWNDTPNGPLGVNFIEWCLIDEGDLLSVDFMYKNLIIWRLSVGDYMTLDEFDQKFQDGLKKLQDHAHQVSDMIEVAEEFEHMDLF